MPIYLRIVGIYIQYNLLNLFAYGATAKRTVSKSKVGNNFQSLIDYQFYYSTTTILANKIINIYISSYNLNIHPIY